MPGVTGVSFRHFEVMALYTDGGSLLSPVMRSFFPAGRISGDKFSELRAGRPLNRRFPVSAQQRTWR